MATTNVPIEIVLQDPNNPIVPTPNNPSDNPGENTNISVPNTALGTGGQTTQDVSSNVSNIFTGSNATVSIISIVVLVLALGTIATLLVRRYQKHKKSAESKAEDTEECIKANKKIVSRKEKLATATTATLAVLAATVLVGNICMTATNAATDNTTNGTTLTTPDKIQIIANRYEDVTIVASTKAISYATTDTTFGYKIFMSMANDNANLYLDGDTSSEYYFAPTTRAGLDINSWGYNFDGEADYAAMPLARDPLMAQQNTEAVEGEEFTVYYTMKADKDMPYGVYSGEIAYDMEGYNGFPASLTTMQDMTSEICDAVYTPGNSVTDVVPTATLKDTRDNKYYEIAKLADGKCWMVQNLDLDLNSQTALTPENTNISANWTPVNSTIRFTGTTVDGWQSNDNVPYSADPGELYIYSSGTTGNDEQYASLAACQEAHPDCSAKNHAGNYYNWSAAVASNNTSGMVELFSNADSSICPTGWELPEGSNSGDYDYSEMANLIISYKDILEDTIHKSCGSEPGEGCDYYNYLANGSNAIRTNPLWLARSGNIGYFGSFDSVASAGGYWSSTFYKNDRVSGLVFGSGSLSPASGNYRSFGYSVRCVAQ